ncbi:MAG: hypothetical protein IT299_01960 [Dehalococcoidia bacterium]|nr:hypothetical protein [Dehalococcoidia bacterium]
MGRSDLVVAGASAATGALALVVTAASDGSRMGYVLGAVLLLNAFVRYQLAQRQGR